MTLIYLLLIFPTNDALHTSSFIDFFNIHSIQSQALCTTMSNVHSTITKTFRIENTINAYLVDKWLNFKGMFSSSAQNLRLLRHYVITNE